MDVSSDQITSTSQIKKLHLQCASVDVLLGGYTRGDTCGSPRTLLHQALESKRWSVLAVDYPMIQRQNGPTCVDWG